jgi:integrase
VDRNIENGQEGNKVDEVTVGSVTIEIISSRNSVKIPKKEAEGSSPGTTPEFEIKYYASFLVPYYEGSIRKVPRRSTLEKARKLAKEVATRLNKDGPRAEILSERDRRIYVLAKASAKKLGLDVDAACRKFVELQERLKKGTLEQAVDFHNDHGQRVKHGAANTEIYKEYLEHLKKRGAGEYHLRDIKRYVGEFVATYPGSISPVQTPEIDHYLSSLDAKQREKRKDKKHKTRARSKNNVRDAIIGFYNFAQEKGYLPQGIPHAALLSTEFRDARKKIETEKDALQLLAPDDIYAVEEMRKILAAAKKYYPNVLPTLEIKAFSGVRTEEMVRLWWVMVCEGEEIIRVPDAVGKVDARRVPILPNLKQRLAMHPADIKHDRVALDWTIANSLYHAWQKVCKKAGVPYRRNAFRNSYFTYRLPILGNLDDVADEGGTSAGELKKNYLSRAPISRAMAEEWFSL